MSKTGLVMSVIQEKGGQGKSNSTLNIASYLAKEHQVLIIDLDGQAADITYYLFGNFVGNSADAMRSDILTIMDVLNGKAAIENVIQPVHQNLDVIPANIEVTNMSSTNKISTFRKLISELKNHYDYILIDVPPTPNWSHVLCLSVCDYVIPIINPDPASPKAFISLNESVDEIRDTMNDKLEYLGVLVNKFDGRTNLSKTIIIEVAKIAASIGTSLFDTKIHQSVSLSEQTLFLKNIFDYAPGSKAAKEYEALCKEILNRIQERKIEE